MIYTFKPTGGAIRLFYLSEMKNEFVPYDAALALKELGFDEDCIGAYFLNKIEEVKYLQGWRSNTTLSMGDDSCVAPLYQQAFRWFREEHNVDCYIEKDRYNRYWFNTRLYSSKKSSKFCYHRYEKAELACLRKLIEIVNKNKTK